MFDREIVSDLDVGEDLAQGPFTITPAVAGTFRWDHQDEVVFTTDAIADGQTYSVTIDSSKKALDGARLDKYEWSFQWKASLGERTVEQADAGPGVL